MAVRPDPIRFKRADREAFLSAMRREPLKESDADWAIEQIGQFLADYRRRFRAGTHKKPPKEVVRRGIERVRRDAARVVETIKALDAESMNWLLAGLSLDVDRAGFPVDAKGMRPEFALFARLCTDAIVVRDSAALTGILVKRRAGKRGGPRTDEAATVLAAALAVIWAHVTKKRPTLAAEGRRPTYLGLVHEVFERGGVKSGHERAAANALNYLKELPKYRRNSAQS